MSSGDGERGNQDGGWRRRPNETKRDLAAASRSCCFLTAKVTQGRARNRQSHEGPWGIGSGAAATPS